MTKIPAQAKLVWGTHLMWGSAFSAFILCAQSLRQILMQTLNVGAGRTDTEYKAAEEQRCVDLRDESRNDAGYFFLAAALAAFGTGLLPLRVNILVNIGVIDLLRVYGRPLGELYPLAVYGVAALWVVVLLGLGFAARS